MTKAKAIRVLDDEYDALSCRRMLCNNSDDVDYLNDLLIALLTAIDALETPASSDYTYTEEYFNALEEAESALVKMQCLLDLIKHNGPQKKHPYFEGKIYRFKK